MFTKLWLNPEVVTFWLAALPSRLYSHHVLHRSWKPCSYVPPSHLTKIKKKQSFSFFNYKVPSNSPVLNICNTHKVQPGTPVARTPLWDARPGILNMYLSGKSCQAILNWNSLSISCWSCSILCWLIWVIVTQRKTRIRVEGSSGRKGSGF